MSKHLWVVRAGQGGTLADDFLSDAYIGIGFGRTEFVGLPAKPPREVVVKAFRTAHPDWTDGRVINAAGQCFRFLSELQVGEDVLTYDPARRVYILGVIESDAERVEGIDEDGLPIRRRVKWDRVVPRDSLAVGTRDTLGAIQTLFKVVGDEAEDVRRNATAAGAQHPAAAPTAKPSVAKKADEAAIEDLRKEVIQKSQDFIADMIAALDAYQLQDLVAGILRAMGYKTRVSAKGADRGVDIFASPDGLGLQEPRIFVEVKHRPGSTMGSQELRAFLGGRKATDRCLYVSTGGFTREARYESERATTPITLIDSQELQRLVREHYERLDEETRRLVPLTKIYWPIEHEA